MSLVKCALGLGAAAALLLGGACASVRSSRQAALMPVFRVDQAHPPVLRTLGAVRAYVCMNGRSRAALETEAIDSLRRSARAKGARVVIDVQARLRRNHPRDVNCLAYLFAKGRAAILAQSD